MIGVFLAGRRALDVPNIDTEMIAVVLCGAEGCHCQCSAVGMSVLGFPSVFDLGCLTAVPYARERRLLVSFIGTGRFRLKIKHELSQAKSCYERRKRPKKKTNYLNVH